MAISTIILGKVVAGLHFSDPAAQLLYMQKLLSPRSADRANHHGHRLPLVVGPAVILLVGIVSSGSQSIDTIYTSIMAGASS